MCIDAKNMHDIGPLTHITGYACLIQIGGNKCMVPQQR